MNFKKAGIFRRSSEGSEQPEVQNDSGGMLAVWGSPGSGKTVTAVKIAKMLSAKKKNVILLLCDMTAPMLPCICSPDELECERSLGNILAAARIGENLIKHNLVRPELSYPNPQESYLLSSILPYLHIRVNDNRIRKLIAPSHGSLD